MAGVVPVIPPRTGLMEGKLDVETERFVTFEELCTHQPSAKEFFGELDAKGRPFLLIDCHCRVVLELEVALAPYSWQTYEAPRGGYAYKLAFDFGRRLPALRLKKIVDLERCMVNICSRHFARGITIDLTKNEVSYVHDSLWVSKGVGCAEEAKDVLDILRWLVDEKKFKLAVSGGESYYRELIAIMGGE